MDNFLGPKVCTPLRVGNSATGRRMNGAGAGQSRFGASGFTPDQTWNGQDGEQSMHPSRVGLRLIRLTEVAA